MNDISLALRNNGWIVAFALGVLLLAPLEGNIRGERSFASTTNIKQVTAAGSDNSTITRLIKIGVVGALSVATALVVASKGLHITPMLLGLLAWLGLRAASIFFGTVPYMDTEWLFGSMGMVAVLVIIRSLDMTYHQFITIARTLVLGIIVASLGAAIVVPDWAVTTEYSGSLLGINSRLFGVLSSPLKLAPFAIWFIASRDPDRPLTLGSLVSLSLALICLLWTQAKTFWMALIVIESLRWLHNHWFYFSARSSRLFSVTAVGVALMPALLFPFAMGNFSVPLWLGAELNLDNEHITAIESFSGRDRIWEVSLDAWRSNPLFGYGPAFWRFDMAMAQAQYVNMFCSAAHSQILQVLGESGLVGALGFFILLGVMASIAVRTAQHTQFATMSMMLMLIVQCISETPFLMLTTRPDIFMVLCSLGLFEVAHDQFISSHANDEEHAEELDEGDGESVDEDMQKDHEFASMSRA